MIDPESPMEERPRGSFLGNVNVVMLTYFVDGVLAFATGILIARALGPEGRGAYGLFVLSAAFGQLVFGLGIGNAAIYYINKRELSVKDVVSAAHVVVLWAAAATTVLLIIVTAIESEIDGFIDLFTPVDFTVEAAFSGVNVSQWLLVGGVTALLYWNVMRLLLQAESRFVALAFTTIAQQTLLLTTIAILVAGDAATPTRAIVCLIAATGAAGAFGLVRVGLEHVDPGAILRPAWGDIRKLARFGVQGETGNVLQLLNYRLDQYIVLAYVSLAGVGIYAVAASMTEAIFVLANAVALVLLPRLTADEDAAYWMAPFAARNTMIVAAAAALALAVIAPMLVPLAFGDEYRDSVEPLWWLLPGTVALAGSKVITSYIFSQGLPLVNTMITAVSLVVTVAADFVFIPWLGVEGAAIASSIAYLAHFAAALFAYGRISGRSPLVALVPHREDLKLYGEAWDTAMSRLGRRPAVDPDRPRHA